MNILIVDDEPAIADTLAYALGTEGYSARCCGLGRDALDLAASGDYALVVLDVGLPDLSGFDVCRELRRHSDIPVIFLTARSDEVDRIVGLELGGDDYVAKPFSPREVVSRVRAILRRARLQGDSTDPAPPGAHTFNHDPEGLRIAYAGTWLALTRYEYRLLALLLERPGRVCSRAHIMETVWADAEDTVDRTIDTHIKTLRAKLKAVTPARDPILTHRGLGYSIETERP